MPPAFRNLRDGGKQLAAVLEKFQGDERVLILGIVRAGVPTAVEIAKHLHLPLDVVCLRRLLSVAGSNEPVCAINIAGTLVQDQRLSTHPATRNAGWEAFFSDAMTDLKGRVEICRRNLPATPVKDRVVLLIDNGATSGHTICAVARALRTLQPARIVVGLPAAARETRLMIEATAEETVCLGWHSPFGHLGVWYSVLDVPALHEIHSLMEEGNGF